MLGEDGERLAKRHGAVAVADLRATGATVREVVGALAGSAGIGDGEAVAAAELIEGFELTRVGTASLAAGAGDADPVGYGAFMKKRPVVLTRPLTMLLVADRVHALAPEPPRSAAW